MKRIILMLRSRIYHKNKFVQYLWLKVFWNRLRYKMRIDDNDYAHEYYNNKTGNSLNLKNPQTFDEKLWYLKLNNRNPMLTTCSDKVLVREYVKDKGLGHILNSVVGVYDDARDIDFNKLPSPCVIKCNHVSGINFIYDKTKPFDKKSFIRKFNYMLKQNYYWQSREWNYKNIKPQIICEAFLEENNSVGLVDYRFLCSNGKAHYLFVDIDTAAKDGSHRKDAKRNVYDSNFNLLNVKVTRERFNPNLISKPKNFDEMKEYAEILSENFPFCRVDFYNISGKIYFGEMTFYHSGGCTNIEPDEWKYKLGDIIDISAV